MVSAIFLSCLDTAHRVDKSSLPDQTLFELLVADIENKDELFQDSHVPELEQIAFVDLTKDGHITSIDMHNRGLKGRTDLYWLSPKLDRIGVNRNALSGTFDTFHLPADIRYVSLAVNTFTGPVNLRELPSRMQNLNLAQNLFTGPLHFDNLPASLFVLYVNRNRFEGTIDMRAINRKITRPSRALGYSDCWKTGATPPLDILGFNAAENDFNGDVLINTIADSARNLCFGHNDCEIVRLSDGSSYEL